SRIAFDTLDEDFSQEDSLEEFGTVEVSDFEDAELEELRVAYQENNSLFTPLNLTIIFVIVITIISLIILILKRKRRV
ncbi:MAG: hypothetical protein FWD82_07330, partial [Defluviitaleaceae bacterium]|nr:hypothetical protein [Defluviitaleaceae bacterium]